MVKPLSMMSTAPAPCSAWYFDGVFDSYETLAVLVHIGAGKSHDRIQMPETLVEQTQVMHGSQMTLVIAVPRVDDATEGLDVVGHGVTSGMDQARDASVTKFAGGDHDTRAHR